MVLVSKQYAIYTLGYMTGIHWKKTDKNQSYQAV